MVNNYENKEVLGKPKKNSAEKDIDNTNESKEDFEYQLSRFLDYSKNSDILSEGDSIGEGKTRLHKVVKILINLLFSLG
jgi:hypothetical protein